MSASDTGDEAPLVQFFNSVRNSDRASAPAAPTRDGCPLVQSFSTVQTSDSASAPASRTVSVSSAASRAMFLSSVSASAKRQSLDAHGRRIDAVAEFQIVGGLHRLEDRQQVPCDRHLADGIGDLAVLDPEPGCAAAVVAGHAVDAGADQIGDIKALLDVRYQLRRRWFTRLQMQIVRSRRR